MKTYCEGINCKKRDTCSMHRVVKDEWYEYIDWSMYGGGHFYIDEVGNSHCETWADCGDDGNYKLYQELT